MEIIDVTGRNSPLGAGAPFAFDAWLALPFPMEVVFSVSRPCVYAKGATTDVTITVFSDVVRLVTGNFLQTRREIARWQENIKKGVLTDFPATGWVEEYVHERDVESVQADLSTRFSPNYFHVDPIPSAVHLACTVPAEVEPFLPNGYISLLPEHGFFQNEIFPLLNEMVNAYRVAVYPWMRYAIVPLSEAIVDTASIRFSDRYGNRLGTVSLTFDSRSPEKRIFADSSAFQKRYETIYRSMEQHEAENQIANTYYLFRMRRWTEALAIAAAVVDNLAKELLFSLIHPEVVAEGVWRAYKFQELFNKVFPDLGLPKLSDEDSTLWHDYVEAKQERGSRAHGAFADSYDAAQAESTRRHLIAFHNVAKWLSERLGRNWLLDWPEPLDPVP